MFFNDYVTTDRAAELCRHNERHVRRKIQSGEYKAKEKINYRGNKIYLVQLSSLPTEAQIRYLEERRVKYDEPELEQSLETDLVTFRQRYGEEGMEKLLWKLDIVQRALNITNIHAKGQVTILRQKLAKDEGIGFRTLCDWIKNYETKGLAGLIRKEREDVGSSSFCLKALQIMMDLYLTPLKRSKTVCYEMMVKQAKKLGNTACKNCEFKEGSISRQKLIEHDPSLKECRGHNLTGLKYSHCEKSAIRILSDIPPEIEAMARQGRKYWEAHYLHKAKRAKPGQVNEVWFGDHYQWNCFCIDQDGNIGRPWLTAWYDMATGCLVGWCISMQPNSRTIAEAFIHASVKKTDVPFCGIPLVTYTDNGRDYRAQMFEGGKVVFKDLGKAIEYNIETKGLLAELRIQNIHAKAYHGWVKPIERWFGTLSDRYVREIPGWCGTDPDERPEDFNKMLKKLIHQGKLWTLDELREYFISTVLPEYHNSPLTGEGYNNKTPLQLYSEKPKARYEEPSWAQLGICKMEFDLRRVGPQGIKFNTKMFWHQELAHLNREMVTIKYNSKDDEVIIVTTKEGKFICAATQKEELKMVLEDQDKVASTVAAQKRQEHETKLRIAQLTGRKIPVRKQASSNQLTGEIDHTAKGNITSLEHEKAMKEYEKAVTSRKSLKSERQEDGDVKKRFERMGERVLQRSSNYS